MHTNSLIYCILLIYDYTLFLHFHIVCGYLPIYITRSVCTICIFYIHLFIYPKTSHPWPPEYEPPCNWRGFWFEAQQFWTNSAFHRGVLCRIPGTSLLEVATKKKMNSFGDVWNCEIIFYNIHMYFLYIGMHT